MTYGQRHRIMMREYYWQHRQECQERARSYYERNREMILSKAREKYKAITLRKNS